jgi:serine/threonine-protein kinase
MDGVRWERLQTLFFEASALPETERTEFLRAGADGELLSELEAMLEAENRAASVLDRGLADIADKVIPQGHDAIQVEEVGSYQLLRFLGEGGMGVVYLAQRRDAGNQVAMKFLLHAGLSPARRERFAREIKLLGKLKHSSIARLYDAGTMDDGTPWFVMEYVEGKRLLEYCQEQRRSADELIQLFRQICEAVQYAHGQEIIHRDLKPSNVMVDEQGVPRLLDFGVAKELHALEDEEQTRSGLRLLTPEYAAPEWAESGIVGPYTDVYSLGLILYQMLTGHLPAEGAQPDAKRPSRSATRVPGLSKVAWNDLDRLCLTAMATEVEERYGSVEALLRDIEHYQNNEPLEAQPQSVRYQLRKFLMRHGQQVAAVAAVLVLLVGMATYFTWQLARERNAALAEAARTRRIERFTLNLFGASDRAAAPSKDLRVLTLVDLGARAASELRTDPETQADLYETLGHIYLMLGNLGRAEELQNSGLVKLKAALGSDNPKVADALVQIGLLRGYQGRFKEAEQFIQQGLTMATRHLPPSDPVVLRAEAALGQVWSSTRESSDKAIAILEPVVRLHPPGEDGAYILAQSLSALAVAEQYTGQYQRAEQVSREVLDWDRHVYGDSHPAVAFDLANSGAIEASLGHYADAEKLYRQSIKIASAWYGETQPDVIAAKSILATVLLQERKLDEADGLLKSVLPLQEAVFGKVHPYVCFTLDSLGKLADKRGDLNAAEAYFERSLEMSQTLFGTQDTNTAIVKSNLGNVLIKKGQYARAELLLREAVTVVMRHPMPGNPSVGVIEGNLGKVLVRTKRYREAEPYLSSAYTILVSSSPAYAPRVADIRADLRTVYTELHEPEKVDGLRAGKR